MLFDIAILSKKFAGLEISTKLRLPISSRRDGRGVCAIIDEFIERTPRVVQVVSEQLPSDFPHHLADCIFDGLQAVAQRLAISG
jgi:hypothetical protein